MLTKTSEYAIRACLFIGRASLDGSRQSIRKVSQAIDVPEAFVAKILQTLRGHDIINSTKGRGGGFSMSKEQREKTIGDIVSVIEGDNLFHSCCLGLSECSGEHPCPVHERYKHIRGELQRMMYSTTIASLIEDMHLRQTFLKSPN